MLLVVIAGLAIVYVASGNSKPVAAKPAVVVRSAAVEPAWVPPPPSELDDEIVVDLDDEVEDTGDDPIDVDVVELDVDAAIDVNVALDIARIASQQPAYGMVMGVVRDAKNGESLAGVTVVATSPSLQGAQAAITDENGFYSLVGLPAGDYIVTMYYLETTLEHHDIVVGSNKVTPLYAKLAQPTIQPEPGITIDQNYVKNIPVPGRYFENPDDPRYLDDSVGVTFSGSGITGFESNQNTYVVDGIDAQGVTFSGGSSIDNVYVIDEQPVVEEQQVLESEQ